MTKKGKIKAKKSPTNSKRAKKSTPQHQAELEDSQDDDYHASDDHELTVAEGMSQDVVYSKETPVEQNINMHPSPENSPPNVDNGQKSELAETSSGTTVRAAVSVSQPSPLQQISSVSVRQETSSGVSSVQNPYGQQLTPLAPTFVPRNYANTFSGKPDPARGTLHSSVDSEASFRYQTPASGEESKRNLDESEWSKRLRALEEQELAERAALDKRMKEAREKLEIEMNRAIQEREIMRKKQEIKRQQEELRRLEENLGMSESGSSESVTPTEPLPSMHQDKTGHQSTMLGSQQLRNLSGRQGDTMNGVGAHFLPQRECTELKQTESRTQEGPLPSLYQNEACEHSTVPSSAQQLQSLLERQQNTMDEVVRGLRMPQREYMSFSGEPHIFPLFMRNFEVNVESKEENDADRLSYLVQYCRGKAREAIEHCIMMRPEEGYKRAKEILQRNFGRTHVVTRAFLEKVVSGPPIRSSDPEVLSQLARDMETCLLGSTQLGHTSNLNSMDTLGKIVARLPIHLRAKWAEKANQLYESQITPTFSHLTEFVQSRAAVANTYFGQIVNPKLESSRGFKSSSKGKTGLSNHGMTLAMLGSDLPQGSNERKPFKCVLCLGSHHLERCHKFRELTLRQRQDLVDEKRVCSSCLSPGHFVKKCRVARMCGVERCQRRHHPLLHSSDPVQNNANSSELNSRSASQVQTPSPGGCPHNDATSVSATSNAASSCGRVGLQVVPVKVSSPYSNRIIETYAFLDSGSNTTMCLSSLAKELEADCTPVEFTLSTVSGTQRKEGQQLCLDVVGVATGKGVRLEKVWTTETLPVTERSIPTNKDVMDWPHLRNIDIADLVDKKVTILIGSDVPEALCPLEVRTGKIGQPHAVRTLLGWTVMGPLKGRRDEGAHVNFIHVDQSLGCTESVKGMDPIQLQLERLYNADFSECTADLKECLSVEDRRARSIMDSSVKMVGGHYEIALPWKCDTPYLPNNRSMAERRLQLLKRRLKRDPKLLESYKETMGDYLAKGHARRITTDEPVYSDHVPVWYLPHDPVVHSQKAGKVRIVFDCAAKFQNTSLNDQLLQGPDFTNSLVGVLLRFREERVALMADVEKMFHQVKVKPEDCEALRFLWWPAGDIDQEPVDHQMVVHLFGATSSPSCCSYALRKTAEDNLGDFSKNTMETVRNNFYVDDCLKSLATKEEAVKLVDELPVLLARGGFRLTKWVSNEKSVMHHVPTSERASTVDLNLERLPTERALGVEWNVEEDSFGFGGGTVKAETRRGILSYVASVYDPLGLAAPMALPAKLILQELCRLGHGWDEELPEQVLKPWKAWESSFHVLPSVKIPRCYKPVEFKGIKSIELHHFADASVSGYGTASYLRFTDVEDRIHCSLVMGKSRVAPLKTVTVPRLELTAATLAVKVDKQLREELQLPLNDVVLWTDSTVVLRYLRNTTRRFQTFVANRLQLIHDSTTPSQWRHVPTHLNPADLASRGIHELGTNRGRQQMRFWFRGPQFLWEEERKWPEQPSDLPEVEETDAEVKKGTARVGAIVVSDGKLPETLSRLINQPSCWYKLQKSVAWLLRFKKYLLFQSRKSSHRQTSLSRGPLEVKEIVDASEEIVRLVQRDCCMLDPFTKRSANQLAKLNPFVERGVVRVGGRLENTPLSGEVKNPAILPSDHHVTRLIVRHLHESSGHSGTNQTLAAVRQQYWIIKGPSTVKRIVSGCIPCRRRNQNPGTQIMAPLPAARVTPGMPPFSSVGIDYFGPLKVKWRRGTAKRYGCIFTCLAIRAMHIEIS